MRADEYVVAKLTEAEAKLKIKENEVSSMKGTIKRLQEDLEEEEARFQIIKRRMQELVKVVPAINTEDVYVAEFRNSGYIFSNSQEEDFNWLMAAFDLQKEGRS